MLDKEILELQKSVLQFSKKLSKDLRNEYWKEIGNKVMLLDKHLSKDYKLTEPDFVSECCAESPYSNGDSDLSDIGICKCGEHTDYGYFNKNGEFFTDLNDCMISDINITLEEIEKV